MADSMFGILGYFKGLVLTNYWSTIDLVKEIKLPILYVTGSKDEIVPTEQTQSLYVASKKSRHAQLYINPDGSHNDTWFSNREMYLATLRAFMTKQHEDGVKLRSPKKVEGDVVRRVVKYATIVEPAPIKKDQGTQQKDASHHDL